ncbi:MAG: aryl-sulfate sulfotransferase [Steroidobacteraceae bacterium]
MAITWAGPSVFPTGVTRYDPAAAYNCDVLFSAPDGKTYLIDMDGHVRHMWNYSGMPAKMLDPSLTGGAKGEIGVQLKLVPSGGNAITLVPGQKGEFADETFGYVNWKGEVVWQWGAEAPGGAAFQHHDWELLRNGDTLLLGNRVGPLPGFGHHRLMLDPVIYEVNRTGRIVWTWRASQHLPGLGFPPARLKVMEREAAADYLHMNDMQDLGPNHWAASGDARFAPDNVLITSRNSNVMAIISHSTGEIVWRVGPKFASRTHPYAHLLDVQKVPFRLERLSGEHDAHMIPEGLPGAGDILVFDNEGEGGYPPVSLPTISGSRVLEINPVTRQVVWQYTGTKASFFSPFISSAQRLPNGNTLIDEGIWGRFIQVTRDGRIVWEYVSPFVAPAPPGVNARMAFIYRIQAVPYDWVPPGVPHSEVAVKPPKLSRFHVTAAMQ